MPKTFASHAFIPSFRAIDSTEDKQTHNKQWKGKNNKKINLRKNLN